MNIVVSQPFFLPWVGLFEQMRLADVFVHYDDVQMPMGKNFCNRVQIKTRNGSQWLTIPIQHQGKVARINEIKISHAEDWKTKHIATIKNHYSDTPFYTELMDVLGAIYASPASLLSDFTIHSLEIIADYLEMNRTWVRSSDMNIPGKSTQRLVDICRRFHASAYITGLGALNYINYELFEENNIALRYMDYQKQPYPQLHGEFTPFVSIIDLIANCGKEGKKYVCSNSVYWKDYIQGGYAYEQN